VDQEWKDVEYLSILDTEFLMRGYFSPAPKSLWDEMLARHQREREELLRWEAKHHNVADRRKNLRRVESTETIMGVSESEAEITMEVEPPLSPTPGSAYDAQQGVSIASRSEGSKSSFSCFSSPPTIPSSPTPSLGSPNWEIFSDVSSTSSVGSPHNSFLVPAFDWSSLGTPSISSGYESDDRFSESEAESFTNIDPEEGRGG
jgi:hypothetical protein